MSYSHSRSTVTKHVKGNYEKLIFQLLDEDTFSRDDLLASCEVSFSQLESSPCVGDMDMVNATGEKVGTIDLSIEYEPGDGMFCSRTRFAPTLLCVCC